LLSTTPTGRLWRERTFYRDIWKRSRKSSGLDIRVNDSGLAEVAGHRVEMMLARYASTGQSFDAVRMLSS
jgi:hypothetical protein